MMAQNRMIVMIAGVLLFYLNACFGTNSSDAESDDDCSVCGKGQASFPLKKLVKGGWSVPSAKFFPWVVGIRPYNTSNHCTGAILDEYFILTAGHCVTSYDGKLDYDLKVYFQTESVEQLSEAAEIENILVFPRFELIRIKSYIYGKNDIALIKLKEKIKCNNYRRSICLPKTDYKPSDNIFVVAGWCLPGAPPLVLQYGTLKNLRFEMCLKRIPEIYILKDDMFCLGDTSQTVCPGDSGGPLMEKINGKYTVLGVASSVTSKEFEVEAPVLYTNVAMYVDWIEKERGKLLKPSGFLANKGENVEEKKCLPKI